MDYNSWIELHYPNKRDCINKCSKAVSEMTTYFKELNIQVGYANGRYHCWCKDKNGNIVDPTAKQFDNEIEYILIADRFLNKDEFEPATGAVFI